MRSLISKLPAAIFILSAFALAQDQPAKTSSGTPIKINYLNVCTPTEGERQAMADALARVPRQARFSSDFEISRGRSTMPEVPPAHWVRIRREFPSGFFSSVQYSVSVDENGIVETLVFRVREPGELLLVTMDDSVSAVSDIAAALAQNTPVEHLKVERFGQSSVALRRCSQANQSAYEPLFRNASEIMAAYRVALKVHTTVPGDLARLGVATKPTGKPKKETVPKAVFAAPLKPADQPN